MHMKAWTISRIFKKGMLASRWCCSDPSKRFGLVLGVIVFTQLSTIAQPKLILKYQLVKFNSYSFSFCNVNSIYSIPP